MPVPISYAGTVTEAPTPSSATDAPPRLFVYGTLAPGRPNEHVLADLEATWTPAQVRGHLVAQGWGAALGHPGLTPDDSAPWVDGLLFESAELPDHWSRLDDFEGPGYERLLVSARLADGSMVSTFVYAIRPAHD
jgi:gamma-glutamylcyclotransferase (GGCT)/AIG2-like uncharacterized protein YtfP